jgi:hypothetical protein
MEETKQETKIEIKQDEVDHVLRSCCFKCNTGAVVFFSQFIFSLLTFIVSIYMIVKGNNTSLFIGYLSLIVGVYIPSPKIH